MQIGQITSYLESIAPLAYQESYDNSGLLTGHAGQECTGVLCTLDATVEIVREAKARGCNLVVAHHPILFKGITRLTGRNYVEEALIEAIKNDIAIYAIHTNLDNVANGVNAVIAQKLGLINTRILLPKNTALVITIEKGNKSNTNMHCCMPISFFLDGTEVSKMTAKFTQSFEI